jgi:hypothetical protein
MNCSFVPIHFFHSISWYCVRALTVCVLTAEQSVSRCEVGGVQQIRIGCKRANASPATAVAEVMHRVCVCVARSTSYDTINRLLPSAPLRVQSVGRSVNRSSSQPVRRLMKRTADESDAKSERPLSVWLPTALEFKPALDTLRPETSLIPDPQRHR